MNWLERTRETRLSPFSINKINYIQYWTFASIFFWLHHISHMSVGGTILFLIRRGKLSRRKFILDSTWRSTHFDFLWNIFSSLRVISHINKKKKKTSKKSFFPLDSLTLSFSIILEHGYLDLSFSIWQWTKEITSFLFSIPWGFQSHRTSLSTWRFFFLLLLQFPMSFL